MAKSDSPYLKNFKGHIDKTIVVKQSCSQTIVTSYPDRRNVKYSDMQKQYQIRFAEAVAYAQSIINDPVKKSEYSKLLPTGKRLFNAAVQEYINPQSQPFMRIQPPKKKRGRIAEREIVIKDYDGKAVFSRRPDMGKVVYSKKQKDEQGRFAMAVAYARSVIADPVKKAAWQKKLRKGKKVYHAALQHYLKQT